MGRTLSVPTAPPTSPQPACLIPASLPPFYPSHPLLPPSTGCPSVHPVGGGSRKPPFSPHPCSGPVSPRASHSVLFHEIDEGRALHLHGLPLPVIHGQHEVEEVGFPEVGGGLLLKMCARQAHAAARRKGAGKPPDGALPLRGERPRGLRPGVCVGGAGQGAVLMRQESGPQIRWDGPLPPLPGISVPDAAPRTDVTLACSLGNKGRSRQQPGHPCQAPSQAFPWAPHFERLISKTKGTNSPSN